MPESNVVALSASRERRAATASGYAMLLILAVAVVVEILGIFGLASDRGGWWPIAAVVLGPIALLLIAPGFYMLQPNQAVSITLFGDYLGTDRSTGLRWALPWYGKKKLSVRANNFISDRIKVNDYWSKWIVT